MTMPHEHFNQIDKPLMDPKKVRQPTLCETHPVTRMQSFQHGKWQEQ